MFKKFAKYREARQEGKSQGFPTGIEVLYPGEAGSAKVELVLPFPQHSSNADERTKSVLSSFTV